jgi:predicted DNA-binding transcriptional regulator YafY
MPPPEDYLDSGGLADLSADERQHHLFEWLRFGHELTAGFAAKVFGVSRRTIARDLAHLREAHSLDISFDAAQGTYVLAEEHTALPFLAFPSLAPILLNARVGGHEAGDLDTDTIHVRFSARAIQGYVARGGNVSDHDLNEDGSLDVYFAPQNPDEFMCYILSRGHHVEVLHPPDFRRRVHMEILRMLTHYGDAPPSGA